MFARSYEELEVFKRAYAVSLTVHKLSLHLPSFERYALGDQIRRASKSVCATLAEGFGKQSLSSFEFKRYLAMSLGSSNEMELWLRYCFDLGYLEEQQYKVLKQEYRAISSMLSSLHKKTVIKSPAKT